MQHGTMGRPSRVSDKDFADRLREQMRFRGWTGSDVAQILKVDKGTVSRALTSNSFSTALHSRIALLIDPAGQSPVSELLHKSLQKLSLADTLRRDAEAMISRALDLTRRNQ